MGVRTKTLVTVLLVGAVVGVIALQTNNTELYKGQIFDQGAEDAEDTTAKLLPDLKPSIEIEAPEVGKEDITAIATIENIGEGEIDGGSPFKYTIFINDQEAFSNTDSYTTMAPGDSFTFMYPIPKKIYQYGDSGTVRFVLDVDLNVKESDETNNEVEIDFSF